MKMMIFGVFLLLCSQLQAQLQWEKRELQGRASLTDTNLVARFPFSNSGDHAVAIKSIQTSCGCTTVTLDKKVYQPREKGDLLVDFVFGDRTGDQKKLITVSTDDPTESTVLLKLSVHIPELVQMEPSTLYWKIGEAKTVKKIHLHFAKKLAAPPQIESSKANILVKLKALSTPEDFEILVTPRDTASSSAAVLTIDAQFEGANPKQQRSFKAFAQIRP